MSVKVILERLMTPEWNDGLVLTLQEDIEMPAPPTPGLVLIWGDYWGDAKIDEVEYLTASGSYLARVKEAHRTPLPIGQLIEQWEDPSEDYPDCRPSQWGALDEDALADLKEFAAANPLVCWRDISRSFDDAMEGRSAPPVSVDESVQYEENFRGLIEEMGRQHKPNRAERRRAARVAKRKKTRAR